MTEPTRSDDAADEDLRTALARPVVPPSSAHDATILAAADRAALELRARRRLPRWIVPLGLAAGIALFGVWRMVAPEIRPPDTLRGENGQLEILPADKQVLPAGPASLHWSPVDGASNYRVQLRDAQGALLGTVDAGTATEVSTAAITPQALKAGTYFWTVFAGGPALEMEYGPFTFQVVAR